MPNPDFLLTFRFTTHTIFCKLFASPITRFSANFSLYHSYDFLEVLLGKKIEMLPLLLIFIKVSFLQSPAGEYHQAGVNNTQNTKGEFIITQGGHSVFYRRPSSNFLLPYFYILTPPPLPPDISSLPTTFSESPNLPPVFGRIRIRFIPDPELALNKVEDLDPDLGDRRLEIQHRPELTILFTPA